jgi:surface protein
MKSLIELNGYSDIEIEYTDARTAGVLFDRPNAIDVSLLINENQTHTLPTGIEINDIVDYLVAQVYVELDFSELLAETSDPVQISTAGFPAHMSLSSSANIYTIGPLQSVSDWLTVKSAAIQLPFGYSGEFDYTATIRYFTDEEETEESVTWTVATTVIPIEYLSDTTPFVYVPNTTVNANLVSIIADTEVFNPLWTLTITPGNTAPINTIATTGTGGTFSFNATTKVATIVCNKTQVNNRLAGLQITFNKANPNFNFTFKLENNINSDFDLQIQVMRSRDLVSDMSVTATASAIGVFPIYFDVAMSVTSSASANVQKIKTASANITATATASATLDAIDFGRMIFTIESTAAANREFALPFYRKEGDAALNATISWGDGTTTTVGGRGWVTKTYATPGTYTVEIRGTVPRMSFVDFDVSEWPSSYDWDNESIIDWISYGSVTQVKEIYLFATMLDKHISAPDRLPPSLNWINAFGRIFNDAKVSNWNTTNLTNMSGMFEMARDFNRPLNSWNVSNVTDMRGMFDHGDLSSAFNQPLNNWDVSNVTDMREMFRGAENFNQNLSGWCVTNITSEPLQFSFGSALTNANKPVWGTCP